MKKDYLKDMSPRVRMALISLISDFYSIEKQHTIVVMPFFGLLHSQGNESKPFLNYVDINILDIMKSHFKDVVVYPGENHYLSSYGLDLSSVNHLAHEQYLLSRIVNRTTNFEGLSDRHRGILCSYEKALADFDTMKEKYPLPYRTAFDIQTPEELISYIKQINETSKQEDKDNKICLLCPISYLIDHTNETYFSLTETMKSIGGSLYFSQNQSDKYLYDSSYRQLFDDQYDEKFVHSIQDFANTYNEDISRLAKAKLQFDSVIQQINNGSFGATEKEIVDNLSQIDVGKLYSTKSLNENKELFIK